MSLIHQAEPCRRAAFLEDLRVFHYAHSSCHACGHKGHQQRERFPAALCGRTVACRSCHPDPGRQPRRAAPAVQGGRSTSSPSSANRSTALEVDLDGDAVNQVPKGMTVRDHASCRHNKIE